MEKSNERLEELERELGKLNKLAKRQKWINVYVFFSRQGL